MIFLSEINYPKCNKCQKGVLLPFFDKNGLNIYGCTVCSTILRITDINGEYKDDFRSKGLFSNYCWKI